jgi:hypothetical protein
MKITTLPSSKESNLVTHIGVNNPQMCMCSDVVLLLEGLWLHCTATTCHYAPQTLSVKERTLLFVEEMKGTFLLVAGSITLWMKNAFCSLYKTGRNPMHNLTCRVH